jgi:glycosyltransferase involved in cell wall biosynthesis
VLDDDGRAERATLLPPGVRLGRRVPIDPAARGFLFVGSLRYPAHGGDLLLEALRRARIAGVEPELIWVAPPDEPPRADLPDWVRLERAQGEEIDRLLPAVLASVTPRRRTPYNDLAVPIKVLEYLGFGRPLLVTDTVETRAIVEAAGCGLVVPDTAQALSDGIVEFVSAPFDRIVAWGAAARAYAEANSWSHRAKRVLELLAEERR